MAIYQYSILSEIKVPARSTVFSLSKDFEEESFEEEDDEDDFDEKLSDERAESVKTGSAKILETFKTGLVLFKRSRFLKS